MNTVDLISMAANNDVNWVYFHVMTADDRQAFDQWLVERNHPLAYQASTNEYRFKEIVRHWNEPAGFAQQSVSAP